MLTATASLQSFCARSSQLAGVSLLFSCFLLSNKINFAEVFLLEKLSSVFNFLFNLLLGACSISIFQN